MNICMLSLLKSDGDWGVFNTIQINLFKRISTDYGEEDFTSVEVLEMSAHCEQS